MDIAVHSEVEVEMEMEPFSVTTMSQPPEESQIENQPIYKNEVIIEIVQDPDADSDSTQYGGDIQAQANHLQSEPIIHVAFQHSPTPNSSSESQFQPQRLTVHAVEKSICLICAQLFDFSSKMSLGLGDPERMASMCSNSLVSTAEQLLDILLYSFKMSPSVLESLGIDISSLPSQIYCSACKVKIFESLKIMNDIEKLERKLDKTRMEIKKTLMSSYSRLGWNEASFIPAATSGIEEETRLQYNQLHHPSIKKLRKTFAQFWSKCDVSCARFGFAEVTQNFNTKKKKSFKTMKTVPHEDVNKIPTSKTSSKNSIRKSVTFSKGTKRPAAAPVDEIEFPEIPENGPPHEDSPLGDRPRPQRQIKKPKRYQFEFIKIDNSDEPEPEPEREPNFDLDYNSPPPMSPCMEVVLDDDDDLEKDSNFDPLSTDPLSNNPDPECAADSDPDCGQPPPRLKTTKKTWKRKLTNSTCSILKIRKYQLGSDLPYVCGVCTKGYRREESLTLHEKYHKGILDFPCSKCPRKFASAPSLQLHYIYIHNAPTKRSIRSLQKPLQGQSRPFVRRTVSRKTKMYCQRFLSDTNFTCEHCGKNFLKKDYLLPDGKYSFTCELFGCGQTFANFLTFGRHHHATCDARNIQLKHICEHCGKDCSSGKTLQAHIVSFHTKKFEFCCEKCGLGLVSKASYRRHMTGHEVDKKYKCTFCPTAYKRKDYLVTHMKKHTNAIALPYTCDKCGKSFVDSGKLNRHKLSHNEGNTFPCPFCNKLFKNKNYVNSHIWACHKPGKRRRSTKREGRSGSGTGTSSGTGTNNGRKAIENQQLAAGEIQQDRDDFPNFEIVRAVNTIQGREDRD